MRNKLENVKNHIKLIDFLQSRNFEKKLVIDTFKCKVKVRNKKNEFEECQNFSNQSFKKNVFNKSDGHIQLYINDLKTSKLPFFKKIATTNTMIISN